MKNKTLRQLLSYEFKNTVLGNFLIIFFGIVFPIFLFSIISGTLSDVPENYREVVKTTLFISMSSIIPLSVMFIGHSAIYANELEKDVPLRLELFGFNKLQLLFSKCVIYFIFLMISLVSIFIFYLLSVVLLVISNSIALIFKKFGITYGITMILYFFIMFSSGMMGVTTKKLPEVMRVIGRCIPTYHLSDNYYKFWYGNSYDFKQIILSFLIIISFSLILFVTSIYINKKRGV